MGFFKNIFKGDTEIKPQVSNDAKGPSSGTIPKLEIVNTKCPYCDAELNPVPQRKKKCPSCGQYIYVKTRPSDRLRVLATEEGARQIEAEWNRIEDEQHLKSLPGRYGIGEKELEDVGEQLSKKFGFSAKTTDIIWAILNQRAIDLMKHGDWGNLASLYFEQALFLHFEEGKECFHILQESKRCQLRDYQYSGIVKKVEIVGAGDSSCAKCQALRGKVFTVTEALESMPIPTENCENAYGYCRCVYLPIID